jgi:tRNA intron endonuclease, catalytic C-terminal domain
VYDPAAHHSPTPTQLESWDASRRQDIAHHQLARLERRRKTEDKATATTTMTTTTTTTEAPIDIEQQDAVVVAAAIQQKRAEREARRRRRLAAAAAADSNAGADADVEADADADADVDVDADAGAGAVETIGGGEGGRGAPTPVPSGSLVYTVSVPTTSDAFAWYNYDDDDDGGDGDDGRQQRRRPHTYETLDAARDAGVWCYPASANERARCEVFRDLWEKGYYMGGGIKFGGDWLVYPGACFLSFFFFFQLLTLFNHSFPSHLCRAHTRRSAALSFALRCHRAGLAGRPVAPDGSRGARTARYGDEEGASPVWLGPREPRGHVHQHRVGGVRVGWNTRNIFALHAFGSRACGVVCDGVYIYCCEWIYAAGRHQVC